MQQLLAEDPSGPGYDGKLAALIGELRHHVEEEETELLPVLSERASDEERAELGTRFAEETGQEFEDAEDLSTDRPAGEGVTRDELYRRAQEQDIPGRSSMSKDELAKALEEKA